MVESMNGKDRADIPMENPRESEETYRTIFNMSRDAIFLHLVDPDTGIPGRFIDVNDTACLWLEYSKTELLSMTPLDVRAPDFSYDPGPIREKIRREGVATFEMVMASKTGKRIRVEANVRMYRHKGDPVAVVTARDIEDRKRAEEELESRGNLLRKIFELLPVGLWIADKTGRLLSGNPAGIRIWGQEPRVGPDRYAVFKARRLPSRKEIAPDDWALYHTITRGVTVTDELIEIDAFDGQKRIVLNYTAPVLDDRGAIQGAIVVNHDITDLKRTEAALRESEERYRLVVENSNDIIWTFDLASMTYTFVSPSVERILGYPAEAAAGMTMDSIFSPETRKQVMRVMGRLTGGAAEPRVVVEAPHRKKNGDFIWLEISASLLKDRRGKPTGFTGVSRDIEGRKRAEAERLALERQIQQTQKRESLTTMAGAIAHHFNNQLTAVLGNLELAQLDMAPADGGVAEIMKARKAAERAADLSRLMLTCVGQKTRKRTTLDFAGIVREILPAVRTDLPVNVRLETDFPPGGPFVEMNPEDARVVALNLIVNAWEAVGQNHGMVRVTVYSGRGEALFEGFTPYDASQGPDPWICLEVADTGTGMDPKTLDRMFDPFFTTKFTGRGLGLAVVAGIVRACDGVIFVLSAPGRGTTVRVFFPAAVSNPIPHGKGPE